MKKTKKYYNNMLKNIKHDLVNPINAMIGYSELILDALDENQDLFIFKDIKSIFQSSNEIFSILQNIFSDNIDDLGKNIQCIISNENLHYSLRTQLSNIIGLSELAIEDSILLSDGIYKDIHDSLIRINKAGKRLLRLINNLKKYSEISNNEFMELYYTDQYLIDSSKL